MQPCAFSRTTPPTAVYMPAPDRRPARPPFPRIADVRCSCLAQ
jgi:hypothetical protein